MSGKRAKPPLDVLEKCLTGIQGLDEITNGGLPRGRPTLVCGGPGSGKTLLSMEFLVHGAEQFKEPGVFVAFEETPEELVKNSASLGFDLKGMVARKKMVIDHVHIERSDIEETGEYNLEGLFVRLGLAIDSIGARRVVMDTIESLFSALSNEAVVRSELRRLFRWLKDKGVTAIITGEKGDQTLTRQGLEEYVSDCVIVLDHRLERDISTRRLQVIKYRGSMHSTNAYPFLIDKRGMLVMPITSLGLEHPASTEMVSSGIKRLDGILGGQGYYRGSTVLITGTAGTGKTTIAASFADASCRGKERVLYFAFEESMDQILRNMRSVGINLDKWVKRGLLRFHNARSTLHGLELHLAVMNRAIRDFRPNAVILDPITSFAILAGGRDIKQMLVRLVDYLKMNQITTILTSLTIGGQPLEFTESGISSLADTWLMLRDVEVSGERNYLMYVLKSRGMAHSNQVREFVITDRGIDLLDVYVGGGEVLTGSARIAQEARERAELLARRQEMDRLKLDLERKRKVMEAQVSALRAQFESEEDGITRRLREIETMEARVEEDRERMASRRQANHDTPTRAKLRK
ncbi:MAG: circadian clock protein KaiC [Deltaproteobacteria bacterium]|nr:circadian clock protein KaiC [Deltaproteobacteria bacterium]MBW2066030.1 circadian clock protein KaiC [Deltaproteobacteria bacterium]